MNTRVRKVHWYGLVATAILVLALAAAGEGARQSLRWSRDALAAGEWWRLFTGHLVHLDLVHALLNLLAAALLVGVFGSVYSLRRTALVVVFGALAIDAGLWWLGEVDWYVGLSGVLHAYAAAVVVRAIVDRNDRPAWLVAAFGLAKIAWENLAGAMPFMATDVAVVTDAHLFGVIAGMLAGLALRADGARD